MSVRRISILLAVASLPFIAISESYFLNDDPKTRTDMSPLEDDRTYVIIPVRSSGAKSLESHPDQTYQQKGKTERVHKETAVGELSQRYSQDQLSDMWSDLRNRTDKIRRGVRKVPYGKLLPGKDVPAFVGNSKSSCLLPENGLTTAEIRCKLTPTFKTCKSYCVYGYTYEEGIVRTLHCNYLENRWSQEFEECKPFIDCYLKMVSPGSLSCVTNHVERAPSCEIECLVYEENDAVPRQNFTCGVDGSWDPYLPHCVEPRGNKILAYPPSDPEHGDIMYP